MSTQIISIGDSDYLVGLKWHSLTSEKPGAELRSLAEARDKEERNGVLLRQGKLPVSVGFVTDYEPAMRRYASAAAVLARATPDFMVVFEDLGEGYFWYAAVRDHGVIPGSDVVGPLDEIQRAAEAELSYSTNARYGGTGAEAVLGEPGEYAPFTDIVGSIDRAGLQPGVVKAEGPPWMFIAAVVMLAAWGGWHWMHAGGNQDLTHEEQVAQAKAQVRRALAKDTGGVTPAQLVSATLQATAGLPFAPYGWRLAKMECTPVGGCKVAWRSRNGHPSLLQHFVKQPLVFLADGATTTIPLSVSRSSVPVRDTSALPAQRTVALLLREYAANATMAQMKMDVGVPKRANPPGAALAGMNYEYQPWTLQGGALSLSPDYVDALASDVGRAQRLVVSVSEKGDLSWKLEGRHVVH